jgi:hypothetical protein
MARLAAVLMLVVTGTALAADADLRVSITSPAEGARIKIEDLGTGNTFSVTGRLSGGTEPYSVQVNGRKASVSPGPRFLVDLPLRRGRNTITATATDGTGATTTAKVVVTVTSPRREGADPRRWPTRPLTKKPCAGPGVPAGRVVGLRIARLTCSRAATVVRSTQRDGGHACTPNRADGKFSRCRAAGFRCYSRFRGAQRSQYACVKGKAAARWYIEY